MELWIKTTNLGSRLNHNPYLIDSTIAQFDSKMQMKIEFLFAYLNGVRDEMMMNIVNSHSFLFPKQNFYLNYQFKRLTLDWINLNHKNRFGISISNCNNGLESLVRHRTDAFRDRNREMKYSLPVRLTSHKFSLK